ncbi:MAG: SPFH domain-containing protein, partial [Planctomycetota bacterium]
MSRLSILAPLAMGALLALPGSWYGARLLARDDARFRLEPGQLALVTRSPDAAPVTVKRSGEHRIRAPFEQYHLVEARPSRLVFGANDEPEGTAALLVRSRNGSIYTLDGLEVHWRVDADAVATAVADGAAGGAPDQRERVRMLATAALRDSFGALDSEEVADAFRARSALDASRAVLDERLARHGLELLQVVAPQPRFDREYEHAIEQRKLLEQEAERLEAEREAFPTTLASMLEQTDANEALTDEMLESELAALTAANRKQTAAFVPKARLYADQRRAAADAERARLDAEAASAREIGSAVAASLAAEIGAFEDHGQV